MAEYINQTVNEVVTGGMILSHSTPEFRKMIMTDVVAHILSGKADNATLAKASADLGKNVSEFVVRLDAVLQEQPHGGNFSESMYIAGIVLSIVTSMTVVLRLCSRKMLGSSFKAEDYLIVLSLVLSVIFASLMQHSTLYGGGTHIWNTSADQVFWVARCLFICEFLYTGGIIAVKASLLIFFYRLTPERSHRISVIAVAVFVALMSIAMAFAMAFQCKPIAWYHDVLGKKCFNELAFWTWFGVLCIVSDILILLLPIPVVWKLQLRKKDKWAVTALFSLGGFVCIASGLRLRTLQGFVKSVDFTSREGAFGLWCLVELDTAIICASIPACKGLFTRFAGKRISRMFSINRGELSKSRKSQMINTFNSSAPRSGSKAGSKAGSKVGSKFGKPQDIDLENLAAMDSKAAIRSNEIQIADDEDPFSPSRSERERARSSASASEGMSITFEKVSANELPSPLASPLTPPLQVPGLYYGRESASTLGDDLEIQRSNDNDVTFTGLSPRNST